jgi:hypothetical protein
VLRVVAAVSLVYDLSAGLTLLLLRPFVTSLVPPLAAMLGPSPVLGDLLGIFLTSVGLGYVLPYRRPDEYRSYLWLFGVGLKTAGAIAFVIDYVWRSASSLLLFFACCDAAVAALTLVALSAGAGTRSTAESRRG